MCEIELDFALFDNYQVNEAFKALRTNIQFLGNDIKTVALTSAAENEGKTSIAVGIAASFAEIDKKVLLIDGDMRKSHIMSKYVVKEKLQTAKILGLAHFLSGVSPVEDIIYSAHVRPKKKDNEETGQTQGEVAVPAEEKPKNFDIIFSAVTPPNPTELLSGNRFRDFIGKMKEKYDYIFIDCPPLLPVIDAAVIASGCDGAVMVIRANYIRYREEIAVKTQLEKSNCRILGVVINFVGSGKGGVLGYGMPSSRKAKYYYPDPKKKKKKEKKNRAKKTQS